MVVKARQLTVKLNYGGFNMADKSMLDLGTIAGGCVISYASLMGDFENWLGFILVLFTLVLTFMRILIALNEWRDKRK